MEQSKFKRWVKIIGSVLSIVLFTYLIIRQDWVEIFSLFNNLPFLIILLVFLLYLCGMIFNSLRWFFLLRTVKVDISWFDTLKLSFVGSFSSNFLPSTIGGDGVRYLGLLNFDKRKDICLSSIVLDRVMNILVMLFILPIAIICFYPEMMKLIQIIQDRGNQSISKGMVITRAGFYGLIVEKIHHQLKKIMTLFRQYFQTPFSLVKTLIATITALFCSFVGTFLIALNLNMSVSLFDVITISAIVYIFTLLPISFNGLGIRELIMTTLYVSLGSTIEQATLLALVTRILMILMTSLGFIWLPQILTEIDLNQLNNKLKFDG